MKHVMQILQESAVENGPLCVGLDTDPSYLPASVLQAFDSPVEAVVAYNRELIRHIAQEKTAACFKVQIAYYEAMGIAKCTIHIIKCPSPSVITIARTVAIHSSPYTCRLISPHCRITHIYIGTHEFNVDAYIHHTLQLCIISFIRKICRNNIIIEISVFLWNTIV